MAKIAVYIGTATDGTNQIFGKQPWEEFFGLHDVEVFGSASLPPQVRNQYDRYRTIARQPTNPFAKIVAGYRDCREYLANHSPEILVQLMRTPTHAPSVVWAGRTENIPVVTRVSGDLFHQYNANKQIYNKLGAYVLNNIVDRSLIKRSTKTIVLGPYQKAQLRRRGVAEEDLHILPPKLRDGSPFTPPADQAAKKDKLQLPAERTVVFYAGRLVFQKGMEFLLDVIDSTIQNDDLQYVLAGDGPYRTVFNQEYDQKHVRTVGQIDYEQIHEYYQAADLYLHPSPYEGIPLSILEALNCGTPVVARNAGDISFVTPNIVDTPEEVAAMISNRAYEFHWRNKEEFSTDMIRDRMQKLLNEILS